MNFTWFGTVAWESIKDLRGTTFSHRRDSGSHSNKPSMPSSAPSCITVLPHQLLSQHGRFLCLAVGFSWDALLSKPQRATVRISWKLDSTSSGPKTGLLSGPWYVLNATLLLSSATHANQLPNRNSQSRVRKVATLAQSGERGRALAAARNAPLSQSLNRLYTEIKSLYPVGLDPAVAVQIPVSNLFLSQVAELIPSTLR